MIPGGKFAALESSGGRLGTKFYKEKKATPFENSRRTLPIRQVPEFDTQTQYCVSIQRQERACLMFVDIRELHKKHKMTIFTFIVN